MVLAEPMEQFHQPVVGAAAAALTAPIAAHTTTVLEELMGAELAALVIADANLQVLFRVKAQSVSFGPVLHGNSHQLARQISNESVYTS